MENGDLSLNKARQQRIYETSYSLLHNDVNAFKNEYVVQRCVYARYLPVICVRKEMIYSCFFIREVQLIGYKFP